MSLLFEQLYITVVRGFVSVRTIGFLLDFILKCKVLYLSETLIRVFPRS